MAAPFQIKPFDAAEYLDTDDAVAAFLADALDSGDAAVFQDALQIAARARGMSEVAKSAGLGRESLYKALKPDAQPRFETVQKVMAALGVSLTISASRSENKKPTKRAVKKAKPRAALGFQKAASKSAVRAKVIIK